MPGYTFHHVEAQHAEVSVSVSTMIKNSFNPSVESMLELETPGQLHPKLDMRHKDLQVLRRNAAEFLGAIAPAYKKGASAATLGAALYHRTYKQLFEKLGWSCHCTDGSRAAIEEGCQNADADAAAAAEGVDNTKSAFASTKSFARYAQALKNTLGPTPSLQYAASVREMIVLNGVEKIMGGALRKPTEICEVFACLASIAAQENALGGQQQ